MATQDNPVRRCIAAYKDEVGDGEGTLRGLARLWNISSEALYSFERKGALPLDRAKEAAARWNLPLRDLVSAEIREAMDLAAAQG